MILPPLILPGYSKPTHVIIRQGLQQTNTLAYRDEASMREKKVFQILISAETKNRGFCLKYVQQPCTSTG